MNIHLILKTAGIKRLHQARQYVADQLHLDIAEVTRETAVAYIQRHFEQGDYSAWDGWVEMLQADEESIRRAAQR